jgi:hypothetical protein
MTSDTSPRPVSPLRARMIEDMTVRGFKPATMCDTSEHSRPLSAGRPTRRQRKTRLFQLHQALFQRLDPSGFWIKREGTFGAEKSPRE